MKYYDTSNYGLIKASGLDAKKYLQGQLTCDVHKMQTHIAIPGAYCNQKGRMISFFFAFLHDEHIYLSMPKAIISNTITALKKYAIFSKVEFIDASNEVTRIGCLGALPERLPVNLVNIPLGTDLNEVIVFGEVPSEFSIDHQLPTNEWEYLRIEAGIPNLYPETQEALLPHPCNIVKLGGIDFKKGCFLGQEIIARMHYRAKLKKEMISVDYKSIKKPELLSILTLDDGKKAELIDLIPTKDEANHYKCLVIVAESDT